MAKNGKAKDLNRSSGLFNKCRAKGCRGCERCASVLLARARVYVRAMCVCVCVCVCEREREREKTMCVCVGGGGGGLLLSV